MRGRVYSLRVAGVLAMFGAALGAGHAIVNAPAQRSGIVASGALLFLAGLAVVASATRLARSRHRATVRRGFLVVAATATTGMVAFEGTVAGPIGLLIVGPLVLVSMNGSRRAVTTVTALILAAYAAVALLGDPGPPGYVLVHVTSLLTLVVASARRRADMMRDHAEMRGLAQTDPLTGCLNRRGFEERLAAELASGRPLLLVTLDLDHFKAVNDVHGHETGDAVLRWTADALRAAVGPQDAVGRVGGDEFAALLPGRDATAAAGVEDAIARALGAHASASIGTAPTLADGATAQVLHAIADARMYAAKRSRPDRDEVLSRAATVPVRGDLGAAAAAGGRSRGRALRTVGAMHLVGFAIVLVYALSTIGMPHHGAIALLGLAGAAAAAVLVVTHGLRGLAPARRRTAIAAYAAFASAVTFAGATLDGGPGHPIATMFIVPAMAAAVTARPRTVVGFGVLLTAAQAGVVVLTQPGPPGYLPLLLLVTAAVAAACCAQQTGLVKQRRMLAELSRTDALTGCLNRRGLLDELRSAADKSLRSGTSLGLLAIDLDGFKDHNDRFGHAAGDELLQWVASAIKGCLRDCDVVGRMGGDEFTVLLPGASPAVAADVAARLAAVLAERAPASVGYASFPSEAIDVDGLQRVADERMYEQKRLAAAPARRSTDRTRSY